MGIVEDIRAKWESMDEIDRKNFFVGIFFVILVIILLFTLTDTAGSLGKMFKFSSPNFNSSIQAAGNLPIGGGT
jgi:hypothetical protein